MNKAKSMRLTKPTIFVAMLIALALVCGMLATSVITATAATPSTTSFGVSSGGFSTGGDGIAFPYNYFNITATGTYDLPVGTFDSVGNTDTNMGAQYYGNLFPSSGDNNGRFNYDSTHTGWDQSAVFGGEFYTNIKLSSALAGLAEAGLLKITISCDVASKYFYSNSTSGRAGFLATLGMSYTGDAKYNLLDGETQPSGNGGMNGADFQDISKGQVHSNDLFTNDSSSNTGGSTYVSQAISWSNTIAESATIGNGFIRLHFFMASDQRSGFYFGNVTINVEVLDAPFQGAGTTASPYLISSAKELQLVAYYVELSTGYASAHYRQTADINLSSISNFTPIGIAPTYGQTPSGGTPFYGTFDGNGYKISNLTINRSSERGQALFGYNQGTIKGVTLVNGSIVGDYYVGGIVGLNQGSNGKVLDCVNYGCAVTGNSSTGGIVGVNYVGTVQYCLNWGTVSDSTTVNKVQVAGKKDNDGTQFGGIAGLVTSSGIITECANYANVNASDRHAGGITGWAESGTTISYCINGGNIDGSSDRAATIICMNDTENVSYTYNFGTVTSGYDSTKTFTNFGNVIREASGFSNCYNNANDAKTGYATDAKYISDTAYNDGVPYLANTRYTDFVTPVYNERGLVNGTVSDSHNPKGTAISSWSEFYSVFRNSSSAHTVSENYYLTADISADDGWSPKAAYTSTSESGTHGEVTFTGILDGNGHTISFNPKAPSGVLATSQVRLNTGFIVDVLSGTIKNLNIVFASDTDYQGNNNYNSTQNASFGGVVGWMKENAYLYNCSITYKDGARFVYNSMEGEYNGMGGVVGGVTGTPTISDCTLFIGQNARIENSMHSGDWGNIGGFVGIVKLDSEHTLFKRVSIHGSGTITAYGGAGNHASALFGEAKSSGNIVAEDLVFGFYGTITANSSSTNISNSAITANKIYWFDNVDSYTNLQSYNNTGTLSNVGGLTGATHIRIYKTMIANNDGGLTLDSSNAYCDRLYFDPNDESKLVLKGHFSASINNDDYVVGHVGYNNDQKIYTGSNGSAEGLILVGTKDDIKSGKDVLFEINKSLPTSNLYGNIRVGAIGTVNVTNTTFNYSADTDLDDIVASIRNESNSVTPNTTASINGSLANDAIGTWQGSTNRANSFTNASVRIYDATKTIVYESWNSKYANVRLQAGTYMAELVTSLNEFGVSFVYCKTVAVNYNSFSTANPFFVCLSSDFITFTVNPVAIEVAPTQVSKTYGDADPDFSAYSVTTGALASGDSLSGNFQRVVGENVGSYAFNLGSIANSNYVISLKATDFTISKRAITVYVEDQSAIYGEEDKPLTISDKDGQLVRGDTVAVITANLSREIGNDVGTYEITANSLEAQNYIVTAKNKGTYTIIKKDVQVIIDNKSTPYGSDFATLTISVVEGTLEYSDNISDLGVVLKKEEGRVVDSYDITIASYNSANYNITNLDAVGTYTITKKVITVTIDDKSAVYGESDKPLTISDQDNQLEDGDDIGVITAVLVREEGNIVDTYDITATSLTADNYEVSAGNIGVYTITKKQIAITIDDKSSIYGSELEDLTISVGEGTLEYSDNISDLGVILKKEEGRVVDSYDITIASYNSANYNITNLDAVGTYTITKKDISVNYDVQKTKIYDGTNLSSATLTSFVGLVGEDQVGASFDVRFNSKNVKEANQISVAITLTGIDCGNYNLTNNVATITDGVSISKATITVSVISKTNNNEFRYIYGDDVNGDFALSYAGFGVGDDENIVFGEEKPVAQMPLVNANGTNNETGLVGVTIDEGKVLTPVYTKTLDNYVVDLKSIRVYVAKKALTVTYLGVKVGENHVKAVDYTGSTFALEYSIEGFVNGENENVINKAPTTTIANANYPNVGTYDVSFVEGVDDNYSFEYVAGTLTINKIALTIKYRDENITFGNTPSGAFEYTGFVPGETASTALTTQASVTLPTDAILGVVTVGTYTTLTPSGAEARNYTISYQSGTLTVDPKAITATFGKTITYGETLVATMDDITVSGLVTGDSKDSLTITNQNLSEYKKAGTHTISSNDITIKADNYTVTVNGSVTIDKAPLTITYLGESAEYNGTFHYPSQNKVEVVGFVASDSISLGDFVFNHDPMISVSKGYGINISLTAEQKEKLTNYDYTTVSGTYIITPRPIIISAVANGKVYGSSDPALTHVVEHATDSTAEAIVGSNLNVLNISVAREVGENVGTYTIDVSYTANSNYSVTTNTAEFTISPLAVNITFANEPKKEYNGKTDVAVSYVIANKVGEDDLTLTNLVANTADANVGENKVVTLSAFALDGEVKGNYTLDGATTNKDGLTITITKATLTVTITHKQASITEGDVVTQDDFSITYAGFVNGETESVLVGTKVSVDCDAVKALVAGTHPIPYIPGDDANYSFDYAGVGTIVVVPARTQIDTTNLIFASETYTYNGENQFVVISWSDMPSYVSVAYSYTDALGNAVAEHKNVGSYKVTASFTVSNTDYYMEPESYTVDMVIGAKDVTVTFDSTDLSKIYDGNTDITLTSQPTVDGLLGEDSITYDLTAKFDDANVGVGKKITLNSTVATPVGATDLNNYNIILVGADSLTADITAKDVTVTFSSIGLSKGYDGNTNIALDSQPIVAGLLGEDSITYDLTAKFEDANVGVGKKITLNSTVATPVGATDLNNYNIILVGADSLTADITARKVDLTYTLNNTKTFDGTTALPEENITNVEIVNAVDGETLSYTITGEYSSKNATLNDSTITLTITKSISGATAGNYYFEDGGIDTVDGKINQKQVTVILEEQTSVYKEAVVVDQNKWHLKEGDSIIEDLGIRIIKAATSENAGTYPLTATKSNDNYHVTFISANYVISQAVTEVKFDLMKKEFEYTGEAVAINMSNFYVYTNRDNITAGIVYPEFATDALGNPVEIKNVGTYTLTFKVVNDTTDLIPDNFQEAEASVTINVLKATPTFDFTEVDQTIYRYNGAEQHITGVTSTNTDGAVVSYLNNTFVDVPDGGVLTITVTVEPTENYYSNTTTHNVTILKADYDLSGYAFDNAEYDYNGTTRSIMAVGLPSSITVSYTYGETTQDTPFAFKDAGIYIVKANYVIDERNYNYPTSLIASASLKINQINITVEVTHQEGYYGEEPEFDPAGIKVIAGNFVYGDPIDLDLKLEPKDSYPIGVYQLVATTTASGNYNVTVARGTYTILPRPVTFRANNQFSEYGDEDAELTYSPDPTSPYEPLENDVFTVALTREEGKIPGKYAITGTIVNPNYAVTLLTRPEDDSHGTYTILPRKITIVLYNQEGTKASQISKKGYKVSGGILRGDDLDIKVVPVDEIGSTPGEYQLTASYNENPNYDVTVKGAIFTLRLATKISVSNLIYTKLYDGVPYVFDAEVSSGAEPVFTVNGIFVENSFTEVGIYEIAITAPIVGDYAEPEQFTFTFEIRPTELIVEQAGITFILSKESGFGADETLDVHQTQEIVLSGENYTQEIDSAYTIYIVKGDERIPLEEYAQGEKVSLKIKLSDELQNLGVSTWFMDSEENVLHAVDEPSEDGFVEVALDGGSMHILFVAERGEAMPLLIIGCAMGLAFVILFFFYLFRKKAL